MLRAVGPSSKEDVEGGLYPLPHRTVSDRPEGRGFNRSQIFDKRGDTIIVLLCGGDKNTQAKDLKVAKRLAAEWGQ